MVYQMKKCRQSLISSEVTWELTRGVNFVQSQYKLIYDSVRDSLLGKFDETDAISDGIKTSLSVENLNEEELHKPVLSFITSETIFQYVNPALMDDSSSDSSGSLTDSDEELPTIIPNTMKATVSSQYICCLMISLGHNNKRQFLFLRLRTVQWLTQNVHAPKSSHFILLTQTHHYLPFNTRYFPLRL